MEAPFDATSWDGISGAIYAGYGSAELLWVLLSFVLVVIAIFGGWKHESEAYSALKKD
ncbi:hypothetical protein [Tropicimonas sediminicola]|uniref:Uncharacterized protein n=1 Tax=Tropicimonas sediminicola TaxID=1031541 RepID=A0A239K6X4_9RHOB|nr:hypothetical protein [Tropicimonas sediminicola]SNT12924.1 hypothetical protein SAMN05421757_106238 [Tropicimonas sediminicola]